MPSLPRTISIVLCSLACTVLAHGQNLVPNSSFEEVTSCPTFASMLGNAAPWTNPTAGTPELFHACAPSGDYAGVPGNYSEGYQWPRTGDGFAGIYVYRSAIGEMREYIMAPLLEPLEAGVCYSFTMFVNAANDNELVCDGVGVHFSAGPISSGTASALPLAPHIDHPMGVLINDTLGWTEVSGSYTAVGGEDHLTIGNFRNDAQTTWAMFNPGVWYTEMSYLLVDDVSLIRADANVLDLGPDTLLCDGATLTLDATFPGATATIWNDGNTDPVRTVSTSGTYSVTVFFGACSVSDAIVIDAAPELVLELGPDRTLCPGLTDVLTAMASGADVIMWDDGTAALERPITAPGTYYATVANACGSRTDSVHVITEECPDGIYLPNAFTPDGDDINDGFAPVFDPRVWEVEYTLYDRWGRALFNSPNGKPWDGADAPQGVYTVLVTARSQLSSMQHRELRGHVVLVR